ncbi:hypothetical protein [Helicobacter cappadocius]|uniref:Uncharacterized protein n=1 Tax=Helicobacter cappadocius TaxID=3063998 RepID=A0AA90PTP7_9HELI|nr:MULTISPECIES: hypothetical protein [unclassified Helicobacter]MDO7252688.1 hypothetical protein [Helicobacter sp. faydin-H75]MDP2538555.1 hypothetical protein [Helicobacter sp. faydin-H76]
MIKKNPLIIPRYIQKQPIDLLIENYLNKQFYLYEIDNDLEILQKVKIPKDIFKNFVAFFSRWEFDVFMPFRLNQDDLDFFKSQIGFVKLDVDSCVDVFLNSQYVNISFDNNQIHIEAIPFSKLQTFSELIPKEFFPQYRECDEELKIISKIIKEEGFHKTYFIGRSLHLDFIYKSEDSYKRTIIKNNIYPKLLREFSYVYKPSVEQIDDFIRGGVIKNSFIVDNFINNNYDELSLGYEGPRYAKTNNINLILQYNNYFKIYKLSNMQRKLIKKYFYKPLPSDHFYLGILQISENSFIIPTPKAYLQIYNEGGYLIMTIFFPSNFDLNELIKIFGMKKTREVLTSDSKLYPDKKQLLKISKIIKFDYLDDYYYELGVTF